MYSFKRGTNGYLIAKFLLDLEKLFFSLKTSFSFLIETREDNINIHI